MNNTKLQTKENMQKKHHAGNCDLWGKNIFESIFPAQQVARKKNLADLKLDEISFSVLEKLNYEWCT